MIPASAPATDQNTSPKSAANSTEIVTTSARRIRHRPGDGRSQG